MHGTLQKSLQEFLVFLLFSSIDNVSDSSDRKLSTDFLCDFLIGFFRKFSRDSSFMKLPLEIVPKLLLNFFQTFLKTNLPGFQENLRWTSSGIPSEIPQGAFPELSQTIFGKILQGLLEKFIHEFL